MNLKRPTPRQIVIKMSKVKDNETIQNSKRKTTCCKQGNPLKTEEFFSTNFAGQREWHNIFKVLKEKKKNPTRNTLPSKVIENGREDK